MLTKDHAVMISASAASAPILLSDAAIHADLHLDMRCGGNGICRRCEVQWEGKRVLACQTRVSQNGLMHVPTSSLVPEELAVESAFTPPVPRPANPRCKRCIVRVASPRELPGSSDWERLCRGAFGNDEWPGIAPNVLSKLPNLLDSECQVRLTILDNEVLFIDDASQPEKQVLGAAIDVGTTTVVVRLMDLATGEQLALAGAQNRQVSLGANVISRIALGSTLRGLELLQSLISEKTILPLIDKCMEQAGIHDVPIHRVVVGGNTVMMHLFLGLSPKGLGAVPFNAVTLAPEPATGAFVGLPVELAECLPAAGAYIGGDVLGGVYALGLDRPGPPELLIDIGTNSEMVLRVGENLYAASAPAGPAFEGGGLSCGGPASPGAITHLRVEHDSFHIQTYKNMAPSHICGSAYIDFLAEGRKHGFISECGRLLDTFTGVRLIDSVRAETHVYGKGWHCILAKDVSVNEYDISLLLQAKASVLSGVQILLRKAGINPSDLNVLHVAGGFGRHLDPSNAVLIGLLPAVDLKKIKIVGNTSLAACSSALLNSHSIKDMRELALRVKIIELNLESDFEECYINSLLVRTYLHPQRKSPNDRTCSEY